MFPKMPKTLSIYLESFYKVLGYEISIWETLPQVDCEKFLISSLETFGLLKVFTKSTHVDQNILHMSIRSWRIVLLVHPLSTSERTRNFLLQNHISSLYQYSFSISSYKNIVVTFAEIIPTSFGFCDGILRIYYFYFNVEIRGSFQNLFITMQNNILGSEWGQNPKVL